MLIVFGDLDSLYYLEFFIGVFDCVFKYLSLGNSDTVDRKLDWGIKEITASGVLSTNFAFSFLFKAENK